MSLFSPLKKLIATQKFSLRLSRADILVWGTLILCAVLVVLVVIDGLLFSATVLTPRAWPASSKKIPSLESDIDEAIQLLRERETKFNDLLPR